MLVKIIKDGKARTIPCDCIEVTTVEADSPAAKSGLDTPGITVELSREPPNRPMLLRLPEDGSIVYVMNDNGKTTDCIRWPTDGTR